MKIKWRVSEAPTGRYKSFDKRGWPGADYEDGSTAAIIYCEDAYIPSKVTAGDHSELKLRIADHSKTPWKWLTVKQRYRTLTEAKEAFAELVKKYPQIVPAKIKRPV